ncbi:MAG: hypothetical protein OXG23_14260 [Chloroflexi bacterium]|nr:hypothetical protein [Chloroflexota bacterium]
MPTRVNIPPDFRQQVKHLQRKYPSVTAEARELAHQLQRGDRPGDVIPDVGYAGVYKERLRNRSARRGKQGGFRLIYYEQYAELVFLLLIYSKTEVDNIPAHEIREVLERVTQHKSL